MYISLLWFFNIFFFIEKKKKERKKSTHSLIVRYTNIKHLRSVRWTHTSGEFVRFRSTGILRLSVRIRHKGRGTGRGGGSRVDRSRMTKEKKKENKNERRTLSHGSSSSARPNKQSLSSLWLPAYLRPATNSQQVLCLFLAFLRKEILCVPAYVLTMKEKRERESETKCRKFE